MVSLIKQGRVQYGIETTPGAVHAATGRYAGAYTAEWKDELGFDMPEFIDGSIAGVSEADKMTEQGSLELKSWLNYEEASLLIACGIGGTGSDAGVTDVGSPPAFTWHGKPVLSGTLDSPGSGLKTATLQVGNNDVIEIGEYGVITDFSISWQNQQRAELTVHWIMRNLVAGAFTGPITKHRIERLSGSKFKLYIDDGEQVFPDVEDLVEYAGCIKGGTFNSGPLWIPNACTNGDPFYESVVRSSSLKPELRLTVETDATLVALRDDWRNVTPKLLSLYQSGSVIHDAIAKDMRINMAAFITDMGPIGSANDNGIATEEIVFSGREDITAALLFEMLLTNASATIP